MEQSTADVFDWTRMDGFETPAGTPSLFTGPEEAAHGSSYMYIEASGRNMDDDAM